jgi:alpha-L-fucosidase
VDNYQPDLLYTDGAIPFEEYGLALVAHLYNLSAKRQGGKLEAVYNSKGRQDCETGTCVLDLERGVAGGIPANPWQTDTCIGNWHYDKTIFEAKGYKTPKVVIEDASRYCQPQRQPDGQSTAALRLVDSGHGGSVSTVCL